jgi:hypothetical protein
MTNLSKTECEILEFKQFSLITPADLEVQMAKFQEISLFTAKFAEL